MKTTAIFLILLAVAMFSLSCSTANQAQSGYGRPDYSRPDYNRPDYSQQGYDQQDYGQPGYDEPYDGDFYDDLAPHGQWVRTPEYGRVWIPNAEPGFQPYASNGHWVVTEYGNTWVSDYAWGWAPFHYGRWYQDRYRGWAWVPGRDWGPAWVSWRSGGGYYGWAPLGPGININANFNTPTAWWTFVPQVYITSPRLYSYCVPRQRVVNIYQNTTIINNVYRVNNRSYAYGPRRDEIERVTRRSVPVYRIENSGRPGRDEIRNNSVGIYRPDANRNGRGNNAGNATNGPRGNGNGNSYGTNRTPDTSPDRNNTPNNRDSYSRPDYNQTNPGTYEGGPRNNQNRTRPESPQLQSDPSYSGNSGNGNGNGRRNRYEPPTQQNQPSAPAPQTQSVPQEQPVRLESVPQPDQGNRRNRGGYSRPENNQPAGVEQSSPQRGNGQAREQRIDGPERRAEEAERNREQPPAQVQMPQGGNGGGRRGPR